MDSWLPGKSEQLTNNRRSLRNAISADRPGPGFGRGLVAYAGQSGHHALTPSRRYAGVARVWKSAAVARVGSGLKVWNPRSHCAGWIVVVVGGNVVPSYAPDVAAAVALSALGLFTVFIGLCLVRGSCLRATTTGLELRR